MRKQSVLPSFVPLFIYRSFVCDQMLLPSFQRAVSFEISVVPIRCSFSYTGAIKDL